MMDIDLLESAQKKATKISYALCRKSYEDRLKAQRPVAQRVQGTLELNVSMSISIL